MTTRCTLCGADGHAAKDCPWRGERVYLVNTGEIMNGVELYERHDQRPPMADVEVLYTAPQPVAVPDGLSPIQTIKYWADSYSDPASGEHFQGHGMVAKLLREYQQLRAMLAAPSPAAEGAKVGDCTCPSGDGSLRWPCPVHPAKPAEVLSEEGLHDELSAIAAAKES